ncbi:Arm DNA-binding domain-containing protein [Trinickia sp. NRRL B-1857]
MPLTDVQIKNATPCEKPYRMADGFGMYLQVNPTALSPRPTV